MGLISRVSSRTYRGFDMSKQAESSSSQTATTQVASEERSTLRISSEAPPRRGVQWTEDTVDNEHMGKKSSKKCCIFHKPKGDDESSSSSDSSDDDVNAYEKHKDGPKERRSIPAITNTSNHCKSSIIQA